MISSTDRAIGVVRCGSPDWVWLVSGISVAEDSEGVWLLGCPAGGAFVAQVWLTKHTQAGVTCLWGVVSPTWSLCGFAQTVWLGMLWVGTLHSLRITALQWEAVSQAFAVRTALRDFYRVQGGTHGTPSESLCKCSRQEICLLSSDQFTRVSFSFVFLTPSNTSPSALKISIWWTVNFCELLFGLTWMGLTV